MEIQEVIWDPVPPKTGTDEIRRRASGSQTPTGINELKPGRGGGSSLLKLKDVWEDLIIGVTKRDRKGSAATWSGENHAVVRGRALKKKGEKRDITSRRAL